MMKLISEKWTSFLILALTSAITPAVPAAETCLECHSDALAKKFVHEGAQMGCTTCHADHDTETGRPARLLDQTSKLCFQCHDEHQIMGDGGFPIGGRPSRGHPVSFHPVSGGRDPLHPEHEFSCASCHNPHSSDQPKFFRYDYSEKTTPYGGLNCAVCHWEEGGGPGPKPPAPPWN